MDSVDAPDSEETVVVELSSDEELPSALDGMDPARRGEAGASSALGRGRFSARPLASVAFLATDRTYWTTRVGAALTHRAWSLRSTGLRGAGETELSVLFPIGGVHGRRVSLTSEWGAWLGPVGLRAGPAARWDRTVWRNADVVLQDALLVGARATLTLQLGPVSPMVAIEPAWRAAGARGSATAASATLPVLGDETGYSLGLGVVGSRVTIGVRADWRETVAGPEVDGVLSVALQLF